ncbi:hypothetical protein [Proteus faecis]|uniref:hypothetical protein n=1 Tax=Proteus faecis TaxID=2050967 RepID=UPI0021BA5596|nr:hypothetical protein [Proteus faecis]MCT8249494.1 hypothetical protein [Proteus faecis]
MSILDERLEYLKAFLSTKSPQEVINAIQEYPDTGPCVDEFMKELICVDTLKTINFLHGYIAHSQTLDLSEDCGESSLDYNQLTENEHIEFLSISDWLPCDITPSINDDVFYFDDSYDLAA